MPSLRRAARIAILVFLAAAWALGLEQVRASEESDALADYLYEMMLEDDPAADRGAAAPAASTRVAGPPAPPAPPAPEPPPVSPGAFAVAFTRLVAAVSGRPQALVLGEAFLDQGRPFRRIIEPVFPDYKWAGLAETAASSRWVEARFFEGTGRRTAGWYFRHARTRLQEALRTPGVLPGWSLAEQTEDRLTLRSGAVPALTAVLTHTITPSPSFTHRVTLWVGKEQK